MKLCAILLLLLLVLFPPSASWGKDVQTFPDLNFNDGRALKEATRVLEEEVKLASHPQTYVLIDLATSMIHIKGRGLDLHQIPIVAWSSNASDQLKGTHKLIARPPVVRRKIQPGAGAEQEPISVADMPVDYMLAFKPSLSITVIPSAQSDHLLQGVLFLGKAWWRQTKTWVSTRLTDQSSKQNVQLQLTISGEHAQSFAWSLVDGMALVIRRPTDK